MMNAFRTFRGGMALVALVGTMCGLAMSQTFSPGNLVVSRTVYTGTTGTVTVGQQLPPNCPTGCTTAIANGSFPAIGSTNNVWNNDTVDGSFGVTSQVFLDQITTAGTLISTLPVDSTRIVTSFSSKSELALNLSADGKVLTFMGYVAAPNQLDVSNANTPGVIDPTNPVGLNVYRAVAQVDANGNLQITKTNAYSGNNGRAAILAGGLYYMVGNSNNGSGTPANVVASTGVQIMTPSTLPDSSQTPGPPQEVGSFAIDQVFNQGIQLYPTPDKAGKDNNFRGLTIFNDTLYVTKGSGSNGINTVYQVGNIGTLPTLANAAATPITILPGFPVTLAKSASAAHPFGIWFANSTTLYVADEGDGVIANAATSKIAGLQKWSLINGTWQLDYVLQNGLHLGQPYSVAGYPASLNPAPDGLRNITGQINPDGTVTIWGVTSTVSANGDQGADPNQLVAITDVLNNNSPAVAAGESFTLLMTAPYAQVLRGVSFTPGTVTNCYVISGNTVEKFDGSGNVILQFGSSGSGNGQFQLPSGLAIDSGGNVWVTDASLNRVQKFDSNGNFLLKFGSTGTGNGALYQPYGLGVDASGNIWVADTGNNRIQEFDGNGNFLRQVGGLGGGNGQFNAPFGVAIDPSGNVWVADTGSNRIQKFDSNGNFLLKFGGFGNTTGLLSGPTGIAIDSNGNVWVADSRNQRIQEFSSTGTFVRAFGGGFSFVSPYSIAADSTGNIWAVDSNNNWVGEFTSTGTKINQFGVTGGGPGLLFHPTYIAVK